MWATRSASRRPHSRSECSTYNASMSDLAVETATESKLASLERRVEALETKVAALPDSRQIDERIQASLPPPVDPTQPFSIKDVTLPIPNADTIVATAKTTWAIVEMFSEIKTLLVMLVDRRYHMGWLTRLVAVILLVAILLSHWWVPFGGFDNVISRLIDKSADLILGLILFMVLSYEMRRYKEWRKGRSA